MPKRTSSKKKVRQLGHKFKFTDGEEHYLPLEDSAFQMLTGFARRYCCDDPVLQFQAHEWFKALAKELAQTEASRVWSSMQNKINGAQTSEVHLDSRENIRREFVRLVQEGHSTREARGMLVNRGLASQPTIHRHTADLVEKYS